MPCGGGVTPHSSLVPMREANVFLFFAFLRFYNYLFSFFTFGISMKVEKIIITITEKTENRFLPGFLWRGVMVDRTHLQSLLGGDANLVEVHETYGGI